MFNNLGIHVIKFPSGRYGFVGPLPITLCDVFNPPSTADIMAGRTIEKDGETVTPHWPSFSTWEEAVKYAASRQVAVNAQKAV